MNENLEKQILDDLEKVILPYCFELMNFHNIQAFTISGSRHTISIDKRPSFKTKYVIEQLLNCSNNTEGFMKLDLYMHFTQELNTHINYLHNYKKDLKQRIREIKSLTQIFERKILIEKYKN